MGGAKAATEAVSSAKQIADRMDVSTTSNRAW
jgi:hypothetical protein